MAFMVPVMKKDWDLYPRSRKTSTCSVGSSGTRSRTTSERSDAGVDISPRRISMKDSSPESSTEINGSPPVHGSSESMFHEKVVKRLLKKLSLSSSPPKENPGSSR